MRHLRKAVRSEVCPDGARARAQRREALPMPGVREGLHFCI
ncbi:unnamed protein product [Larinioides sclopetarius]|uniref:Uncharacterized protein n=2 Tax=Larinioides sclopetarius TaxID=280406 RepID=A0AAV2BTQ3_9ARAC